MHRDTVLNAVDADVVGQTDSARREYGGDARRAGYERGMKRTMDGQVAPKLETDNF